MQNENSGAGGAILVVIVIVVILAIAMSSGGGRRSSPPGTAGPTKPTPTAVEAPAAPVNAAPPTMQTIREAKAKTGEKLDDFETETDKLQATLGELIDRE